MRYFGIQGPVLEVGSGHRPYPHSDVLVDKLIADDEREGSLRRDGRPIVVCDLEALPFGDRVFGYAIAAHVVEHVHDPTRALGELERVARAGYIETPSALMERIEPHRSYHRWSVALERGELLFAPKPPAACGFHQHLTNRLIQDNLSWKLFAHTNPRLFKTALEWRERITYRIVQAPPHPDAYLPWVAQSPVGFVRALARKAGGLALRHVVVRRRRTRRMDLAPLLRCPRCSGEVEVDVLRVRCPRCRGGYPRAGQLYFLSPERFEADPS